MLFLDEHSSSRARVGSLVLTEACSTHRANTVEGEGELVVKTAAECGGPFMCEQGVHVPRLQGRRTTSAPCRVLSGPKSACVQLSRHGDRWRGTYVRISTTTTTMSDVRATFFNTGKRRRISHPAVIVLRLILDERTHTHTQMRDERALRN